MGLLFSFCQFQLRSRRVVTGLDQFIIELVRRFYLDLLAGILFDHAEGLAFFILYLIGGSYWVPRFV